MKIIFRAYVITLIVSISIGLVVNLLRYFGLVDFTTGLTMLGYTVSVCVVINFPCALVLALNDYDPTKE